MKEPLISVIIINYNTFQLTCNCIESVYEHTKGSRVELILVDNNSGECDPGAFTVKFPGLKLVTSPENVGFAKGNNLGIGQASGEYILLLNSDTLLTENTPRMLAGYLAEHRSTAVVSPKLIYPDGTHQSVCQHFPSVRYKLFELMRLHKLLPEKTAGRILLGAFFDHSEDIDPDWVWGTCFMFRKELLDRLKNKKLDDTYFMYGEDMQWCFDFRRLGYGIHYTAETSIIHLMGGSAAKKEELMAANNRLFLERNYSSIHRRAIEVLNNLLGISS